MLDEQGLRLLAAEIEEKMGQRWRWSPITDYDALSEWVNLPHFVADGEAPC